MPTLADTVSELLTRDEPVLFLDTCILLDIVRATYRCLGTTVADASEIRRALGTSPPSVSLVLASWIFTEWQNNITVTQNDVAKHLESIQDQSNHFYEACQALGVSLSFTKPDFKTANLHQLLHDLSKELLECSISVDDDATCTLRGHTRAKQGLPPSIKGREVKDCVILETCLEVTRQLRSAGFSRPCVFCTSNTKDYGKPEEGRIPEFSDASLNLVFTTTLSWARSQLTT